MSKLHWVSDGKRIRAHFAIQNIGELTIEVEAHPTSGGPWLTEEERHQLALRHAELLVRGLAAELKYEVLR